MPEWLWPQGETNGRHRHQDFLVLVFTMSDANFAVPPLRFVSGPRQCRWLNGTSLIYKYNDG